jgi:aminoglycoside phosphotransferase (APT) family kinase protein
MSELADEMLAWVEATLGGKCKWERTPGGGSRETYFVDVTTGGGETVRALLRMEAGGSFTGTEINVAKEATAYAALGHAGVRVPKVYGVAPGGAAVLLERVAGRGDTGDTAEERERTLEDFIDVIADMHLVDTGTLELPGFPRPVTPEEHARLDLEGWARLAADIPDVDPLALYAGAWLRAHPPVSVARTSFVQGDTGPGNFVADHGRVTALCDMEFSHLGDPMDDVAWILGRAFGQDREVAAPFFDRYVARTGIPIDWESVEYYNIAVQYRCVITTGLAVSRGGGARGWPPYLLVTQRYMRTLARLLALRLGAEQPPPLLPTTVESTPRSAWYDALMNALRKAVKALDDTDLAEDTRNHQILVHYLRAYDRIGSTVDSENADDVQKTMGMATDDEEFPKRVEDAGAAGDTGVLAMLLRCHGRNWLLWQSLLDRPARPGAVTEE